MTKKRHERNMDLRLVLCFRMMGQMCTGYGLAVDCLATLAQSKYKFSTERGKFATIDAIAIINPAHKEKVGYFVMKPRLLYNL